MIKTLVIGLLFSASCYNPNIKSGQFACDPAKDKKPVCPSGFTCMNGLCVNSSGDDASAGDGGGLIPKQFHYMGTKTDPQLSDLSKCPDYNMDPTMSLEPNDTTDKATPIPSMYLTPDGNPPRVQKLAICPQGTSPLSNAHDRDYFKVDLSSYAIVKSMTANIFYSVALGDLDVAILDKNGAMVAYDGSAVDNGCVANMVANDIYYIVVTGADDIDANQYELKVNTYSTQKTCATISNTDMAGCKAAQQVCLSNGDCCSNVCNMATNLCQ